VVLLGKKLCLVFAGKNGTRMNADQSDSRRFNGQFQAKSYRLDGVQVELCSPSRAATQHTANGIDVDVR